MACRMFGAKPLSKPMLPYWQLAPTEHISEMSLKIQSFIQVLENVVRDMMATLSLP